MRGEWAVWKFLTFVESFHWLLKHRFQEARACINDCTEARAGSLEFYEELYTAQKAVDGAFNCYVDLLDDFRRASDEQLKSLCQDRLELANALKSLRAELHQLAEPKQNNVAWVT